MKLFPSILALLLQPCASAVWGNARITPLTDRLIRFEWSAAGQFEDRPSVTFSTRSIATAPYQSSSDGDVLTLRTEGNVTVIYNRSSGGRFTEQSLQVTFGPAGQQWLPKSSGNLTGAGNLNGTLQTTDCYAGAEACVEAYYERMQPGLISRDGWVIVDDSRSALFEHDIASGWNWRSEREQPAVDWYGFFHGTDYRALLGDFVANAGPVAMMDRAAYPSAQKVSHSDN